MEEEEVSKIIKMELFTERMKLKDILPEKARDIAKEYKLKEDDIEFIRKKTPLKAEDLTIEDGERAAIRYVNTADLDRDNEIVMPSGGQVNDFKKSPTVLYAHDYRGLPIGKDIWIKLVQGKGWLAKTVYAKHQLASDVYNLVKEKFLNTSSIGFIPLESAIPDKKGWDKAKERVMSEYSIPEKIVDKAKRIYTKWLLLEHSDVPIASNISALNIAVGKGLEIKSKELIDDLNIEIIDEKEEIELIEENKKVVTKPEETEDFIHIPVIDAGKFVKDSFRTIDIDKKKGIKAVIGKLKTDPQGSTKVQKFIFDKKKGWTLKKAQEWVRKHGKSIIYQCVICDKYFMDSPSANRKTCSTKCGYKYLSQLNSGENHPQYKGGKEERICEQCGGIFTAYKGSSQKYCSIECHNKAMEIEKEIGICPICGKEFDFYPSNPQIYCSRECFYKGNMEYFKSLNKSGQLTEAQLEALGNGRLNRFGGYQTECDDGHIVQSNFEAEFDNWLYKEGIEHNIQVRVCNERYWTCDFVLIKNDGQSLWVELDGMGKMRKEWGHAETWEEKINYYKENDYRFIIIDKDNIREIKEQLKEIFPEQELFKPEEKDKSFSFDELYEIVKENKELKEKHKELELKAGAVLNAKNKRDLKNAQKLNQDADALIQAVLDSAGTSEEGKAVYECECLSCGWKHTSEKHCDSYKCEKCGGEMRRSSRPGPGKELDEIELDFEPEKKDEGIELNANEIKDIIKDVIKENVKGFKNEITKGIDDNFKRATGKVL